MNSLVYDNSYITYMMRNIILIEDKENNTYYDEDLKREIVFNIPDVTLNNPIFLNVDKNFIDLIGFDKIKKLTLNTNVIVFDITTGEIVLNLYDPDFNISFFNSKYRKLLYENLNLEYFKSRPDIYTFFDCKNSAFDDIFEYIIYDNTTPVISMPTIEYTKKTGIHINFNTDSIPSYSSRAAKLKAMVFDD